MLDRKIKICHMTSAHKSNDMRIFQKECRFLATQDDFQVFLVAQGECRNESSVKVVGIGDKHGGRLKRMFHVSREIYKKALELDADIYHFHDPELLLYAKKLKRHNKIVVFDSHEDYPKQIAEKEYIPYYLRRLISVVYKLYETHVVKHIDAAIIPTTTNGKNPFEGRCPNVLLIDNYPILDNGREYQGTRTLDDKEKISVCYTGGLTEERGITFLVKACFKANAKLILAGPFSSQDYMDKIMKMEEASCVDYRGICNYDEVTKIYQEADIGAATLLKVGQYATMENLPTKTYEYMQMKLPIIMSDTKYNRSLMQKYDFAYLVNPSDVEKISEKINYIAEHYGEAKEKAERGYILVRKKYNWDMDFEKLVKLYRFILQNKKREI